MTTRSTRQWLSLVLSCALALVAVSACRRAPASAPPVAAVDHFSGTWVMRLDQQVLMVLTLRAGDQGWVGTLSHPEKMSTDGFTFSALGGPPVTQPLTTASHSDTTLRVVVTNAKDPSDNTSFEITLVGRDEAAVKLAGTPFPAWPFTRHRGLDTPDVATTWDAARAYIVATRQDAPNPEMQAIYAEDQAARQKPGTLTAADWERIDQEDTVRRERTRALMAKGDLRAGEDFRNAAFIFQHGGTPEDYLLAHTLALVALARGDAKSAWIAAATLDRYLQAIDKPQIYGTQFGEGPGLNQEPYDRALVSDALRRDLMVPAMADQVEQFRMMSAK